MASISTDLRNFLHVEPILKGRFVAGLLGKTNNFVLPLRSCARFVLSERDSLKDFPLGGLPPFVRNVSSWSLNRWRCYNETIKQFFFIE